MSLTAVRATLRRVGLPLVVGLCAAAAVVVVRARPDPASSAPTVRLDGPIESFVDAGTVESAGIYAGGGWYEWGGVVLKNRAPDAARITRVKLMPGGGSVNLPVVQGIFAVGVDRDLSRPIGYPPWHPDDWGTARHPVVGFELAGRESDKGQVGSALVVRMGLGDLEDASFRGLEVFYTWHGDDYKAYLNQAVALCRKQREKDPNPIACSQGPPAAPEWPDDKWD